MASADLPTAVGPTMTTSVFFTGVPVCKISIDNPKIHNAPWHRSPEAYISPSASAHYIFKIYLRPESTTTMIKYTASFLTKLEDIIAESDYVLRYEKGNFKSGYCILKDQKIIIVNKFYTTEGKINALLEILKNVTLDMSRFSEKSSKLFEEQ